MRHRPFEIEWMVLLTLSIFAFAPGLAAAQALTISETENWVRATYFEGMPEEQAARVGPDGVQRLIEMLADPAERVSHSQILLALGLCGSADSVAAISEWIDTPREGEIDRATFRAWQALPFALGHLARHDRRALVRLESLMDAPTPGWTFRHHRGARLARLQERAAVTSLAMTGLPEAGRALDRAGRNRSDAEFQSHVDAARAMHRARADEVTK